MYNMKYHCVNAILQNEKMHYQARYLKVISLRNGNLIIKQALYVAPLYRWDIFDTLRTLRPMIEREKKA